jgi:hypothetical protein
MSRIERDELDRAITAVAGDPIEPAAVEGAAARVWQHLGQESAVEAQAALAAAPSGPIADCADFQALIPAFVAGQLTPARHALVEDHTRHCIPCRRALRESRDGKPAEVAAARTAEGPSRARRTALLALAAALVLTLGAGLFVVLSNAWLGGSMAKVAAIDGNLFRVDGDNFVPVRAGDSIPEGDIVRTARGSHAVLRMNDGSMIEMSERAGLSLDAALSGNTIELERGQVIVQAAQQRPRHLYLATDDCRVAVTGTVFSVNSGTKGSRVSVVEGEVHVDHAGKEDVLHAGGQVTTHDSVAAVPVAQEIGWSRDAAKYQQLLTELTALGRQIDQQVDRPAMRFGTRLLDIAPEGTTIYIGLPNLAQSLAETQRLLEQKVAENPILSDWWSSNLGSSENAAEFHDMIQRVGDLGKNLGDEIAVAVGPHGEDSTPVLYAQVTGPAFVATLDQEIARINQKAGHQVVRRIADPAAPDTASGDALRVWVGDGVFVASPEAGRIALLAANAHGAANPFAASAFRQRIAQVYQDGAGFLLAADLKHLMSSGRRSQTDQTAESLGIYDVEHFIVNRRDEGGRTETRAALTFDRARRGIASWLDAPGPMGSLGFFSPDANLVGAFVVREPVTLVDELLTLSPDFAAKLAQLRQETGIDLRNDLAAPLGGEVAFGLDGPLLPTPSYKVVVEVYNPEQLQQTFQRAVARINQELAKQGKPGVTLRQESAGGRTYYTLVDPDGGEKLHYTFAEGYLLAAPSRALLDRTLSQRAAGATLASAAKFRSLLGHDGEVNVSALVYQNLASTLESVGKLLPKGAGQPGRPDLRSLLLGHGPGLIYAYGEPNRILFAGTGERGVMGINLQTLAGLGGIAGLMDQMHGEAKRQADSVPAR